MFGGLDFGKVIGIGKAVNPMIIDCDASYWNFRDFGQDRGEAKTEG